MGAAEPARSRTRFLSWILYRTDPAQHITVACSHLDYLDHDLSDVWKLGSQPSRDENSVVFTSAIAVLGEGCEWCSRPTLAA